MMATKTATAKQLRSWAEALNKLLKGKPTDLDAYLTAVGTDVVADGTKAKVRCRFVGLDGNGRPRICDLAREIAHRALDYSVPRSKVRDAIQHFDDTGSTVEISIETPLGSSVPFRYIEEVSDLTYWTV